MPARALTASPVTTSTCGSAANSARECAASRSSSSTVTSAQPGGIALGDKMGQLASAFRPLTLGDLLDLRERQDIDAGLRALVAEVPRLAVCGAAYDGVGIPAVIAMQFENPDIKFVVPEEGLAIWADNMMVPAMAQHTRNAEDLMNFYYDPAIAAQLTAYVRGERQRRERVADPEDPREF